MRCDPRKQYRRGGAQIELWKLVGLLAAMVAHYHNNTPVCHGWTSTPPRRWIHGHFVSRLAAAEQESTSDSDDDAAADRMDGPERSRMLDYVADFLQRTPNDEDDESTTTTANINSYYTHLIALPVDACHELAIELESVQRAILYHCPVLVHSCLASAVQRLPLLLVRATAVSKSTAATSHNERGDRVESRKDATEVLQRLVQRAVEEQVWNATTPKEGTDTDPMDTEQQQHINAQGLLPLNVPFATLEIDAGSSHPNQVLSTVADPQAAGTRTLQALVQSLQDGIQTDLGWDTCLPHDPHGGSNDDIPVFRPRIPFMRLPEHWEELLEEQVALDDAVTEAFMLTSDQGGNGISPLFWGKWCDDAFCGGGEQRLSDVAVYEHSGGHGGNGKDIDNDATMITERAFRMPAAYIPLPEGTAAQMRAEARFGEYQEQRMREAETALKRERQELMQGTGDDESSDPNEHSEGVSIPEGDLLLTKTKERLEQIYNFDTDDSSPNAVDTLTETCDTTSEDTSLEWEDIQDELVMPPLRDADPDAIDEWTRTRIEDAVRSRARVQSELALAEKKAKDPNEQNDVFSKYIDGSLLPEKDKVVTAVKELPPFPSREHCTGFWRMLATPTGFEVEEGDANKSDNLVLRVDGTIAGGPILDQETRQKASGGTWKLEISSDDSATASLRIRLIIPPKKERILVMDGTLEKVSMKVDVPLTSSTFGIPALEEKKAAAAFQDALPEDLLYCKGSVWIEDASTKANRDDIGSFSIVKLNTPTDPSQFTVTIPKNIRNLE